MAPRPLLGQVDFAVIRTFRTDNFGRYLIDLRYLITRDAQHRFYFKGARPLSICP